MIGAEGRAQKVAALRRYSELLLDWNRNVSNLISRHDEPRILERHIRESIEPSRLLAGVNAQRWLDLGSGAGLPAVPLSIAGVGAEWTLVESRRTKTLFIRKAVEDLKLSGIEVVLGRLEILIQAGQLQREYDAFISRATLALAPTLDLAANIVVAGGHAFLWKGSRKAEEMGNDNGWKEKWDLIGEQNLGSGLTSVVNFKRKN